MSFWEGGGFLPTNVFTQKQINDMYLVISKNIELVKLMIRKFTLFFMTLFLLLSEVRLGCASNSILEPLVKEISECSLDRLSKSESPIVLNTSLKYEVNNEVEMLFEKEVSYHCYYYTPDQKTSNLYKSLFYERMYILLPLDKKIEELPCFLKKYLTSNKLKKWFPIEPIFLDIIDGFSEILFNQYVNFGEEEIFYIGGL